MAANYQQDEEKFLERMSYLRPRFDTGSTIHALIRCTVCLHILLLSYPMLSPTAIACNRYLNTWLTHLRPRFDTGSRYHTHSIHLTYTCIYTPCVPFIPHIITFCHYIQSLILTNTPNLHPLFGLSLSSSSSPILLTQHSALGLPAIRHRQRERQGALARSHTPRPLPITSHNKHHLTYTSLTHTSLAHLEYTSSNTRLVTHTCKP